MIKFIPFRKTLPFRILIVSIILLALPLLVDSFIMVQRGYEDAVKDAKNHLVEVVQSREVPLAFLEPGKEHSLAVAEYFLKLRTHFPERTSLSFDLELMELREVIGITGIALLKFNPDMSYTTIASSYPPLEGRTFNATFDIEDIFSPRVNERGYFTFFFYDTVKDKKDPFFGSGRVVYDMENKPLGILIFVFDLKHTLEQVITPENSLFRVNFAVLMSNTLVFAATDPTLEMEYFAPISKVEMQKFLKDQPYLKKNPPDTPIPIRWIGFPFFEFKWNQETYIGYLQNLSSFADAYILAYASKKEIFTKPFIDFFHIYGVFAFILIAGGLIAYFLTRRLGLPIKQLNEVMREIQRGNVYKRYQPDPIGYELNLIGSIFNNMMNNLLQKKALAEDERVQRETYSKELIIGQQVQRSLLPETMPKYPGVDMAAEYIPAKVVGGDFYDIFIANERSEEKLVLAIADASGKGVQACFYSLGVRSMFRTFATQDNDVATIMKKTNSLFCLDVGSTGMFVTALMGKYDDATRRFDYFSCGHNPPLWKKKSGEIVTLNHLSCALGLKANIEGTTQTIYLEKGDYIVFYTDGITEAHNENLQLFTEERLIDFLATIQDESSSEVIKKLLQEVSLFVGNAPQHDDITLLIMKVI